MNRVLSFTTAAAACEYRPERLAQHRYDVDPALRAADYMNHLKNGWRRFGPAIFRPACPACSMCRSVRVPVAGFRPSATQRRIWRKNAGSVTVRIGTPSESPEKLALWRRFHRHGQATKGWPPASEDGPGILLDNPFPTEEWTYYCGDRLIGLGYVDALSEGLSAIYFCWEPQEARRSPGTFNLLTMIAAAKDRGLPHVYLGYYVEGCRSLEYKGNFRENEVLAVDGTWQTFLV